MPNTSISPRPDRRIGGLALVDFDRRHVDRVAPKHEDIELHFGATGLARLDDGFVVLLQGRPTQAVVLDGNLEVVHVMGLPHVPDPHSILVHHGAWYAIASGSDSVVEIDPGSGRQTVVWRAPRGGVDVVHVNSIFLFDGELCVSVMCRRDGSLAMSTDGIVLSLQSGEVLLRQIFHPHSARQLGPDVVACESSRGRIVSTSGSALDVPLGYVRGLDITEHHLLVGTSRHRNPPVGRCTAQLYEHSGSDIGEAVRASVVHVAQGNEIFDVLAV